MIYRFSDNMAKMLGPEEFEHIYKKSWLTPVYYMIDRKFRKSVNLVPWLQEQVEYSCESYDKALEEIPKTKNMDLQVRYVQNWVMKNIRYTTDQSKWGMPEKWESAEDVLLTRRGDCESGALVIYILCRKLGVPSYRLMLMAGDVKVGRTAQTGGHAWVAYKPFNYPLNWVFMDWCYYANTSDMESRPKYLVVGKTIISPHDTSYKTLWFAFNENMSFRELRTKN